MLWPVSLSLPHLNKRKKKSEHNDTPSPLGVWLGVHTRTGSSDRAVQTEEDSATRAVWLPQQACGGCSHQRTGSQVEGAGEGVTQESEWREGSAWKRRLHGGTTRTAVPSPSAESVAPQPCEHRLSPCDHSSGGKILLFSTGGSSAFSLTAAEADRCLYCGYWFCYEALRLLSICELDCLSPPALQPSRVSSGPELCGQHFLPISDNHVYCSEGVFKMLNVVKFINLSPQGDLFMY